MSPHAGAIHLADRIYGSAGMAIVLMDRAALFVDVTLYAAGSPGGGRLAVFGRAYCRRPAERWIENNLTRDDRLGYDPWLLTFDAAERMRKACSAAGASLIPTEPNLIDDLWSDRPPPLWVRSPCTTCNSPENSAESKHGRIVAELVKSRADALVISDPHAVAWSFNIRGADVAHTPLPLSFAIVPRGDRPSICIDGRERAVERRARPS